MASTGHMRSVEWRLWYSMPLLMVSAECFFFNPMSTWDLVYLLRLWPVMVLGLLIITTEYYFKHNVCVLSRFVIVIIIRPHALDSVSNRQSWCPPQISALRPPPSYSRSLPPWTFAFTLPFAAYSSLRQSLRPVGFAPIHSPIPVSKATCSMM